MIKLIYSLAIISSLSFLASAQNPYASIGKKTKPMLSLSNGKYAEHFENDSIRQIGSVMVNMRTEQIVAFVDRKEQAKKNHSKTSSRFLSIDPLARQFPFYTPYQYAGNTPIQAIDLDGAEALTAQIVQTLANGKTKVIISNDETVKNNATVDFQFRIPANLSASGNEEIYRADNNGNQNFGYSEIKKGLGGNVKRDNARNLYIKDKFVAYAVANNDPTKAGANYAPFLYSVVIDGATPTKLVTDALTSAGAVAFGISSDFNGDFNSKSYNFTSEGSGTNNFNINFDDNGIKNTFSIINASGNVLNDASGNPLTSSGKGTFSFSVPTGTNFNLKVTNDTNTGMGDKFDVNGTTSGGGGTTVTQSLVEDK